jgi:hypothetical protein
MEDDEQMKLGDDGRHIRGAKQALNGALKTYRDADGGSLDQGRAVTDLGWRYGSGMADLVRYLLVRVLGVAEENADGSTLHSAELVEIVRRAAPR